MSIQLILHPQNYEGQFNTISSSPTEVVVNGISFAGLDNTGTYTTTAANHYVDTLTNAPPSIINTWYRFRKGTIAYPTVVAGDVNLVGSSSEISGVYQQLSNLTLGGQYTVTINIPTAVAGGSVRVAVYLGTSIQGSYTTYSSNTTQISKIFFATSTELTVMISYSNATSTDLIISDISTQPVIGAIPSGSTSILDNGQVIVDLYEDEDLPLTLSVDNFKNVAEKVQSYSKAFNLPATKRNNKIFNQIFDVTRSNDGAIFNPYKKTQCVLKQDGFILFEGYLRLLDVSDKLGETSYNVNLYSEVIALSDFLKDREFRDLDFSELNHAYNYPNIRNSWQGILPVSPLPVGSFAGAPGATTTNVLKYPFVDWNHQYTIGGSGNPVLPNLESAFRPFISIKYILNRIFEDSPFTYESTFFNTTVAGGGSFDFNSLYMDFNWGSDNVPFTVAEGGEGHIDTVQVGTTSFATIQTNSNDFNTNLGYSAGVYTAISDNQTYIFNYSYTYNVTNNVPWTGTFRWKMVKGGVTSYINITPVSGTGIIGVGLSNMAIITSNFTQILDIGDTLTPEFKSSTASTNNFNLLVLGNITTNIFGMIGATFVITSATAATNNAFLQTLRGETGQWDFLKGLITMFNLVTLVDEDNPNNIIIEPYSDVFINSSTSVQLDWTDKIDVSEMKLTPLVDLNKRTIFKFVEDEDDYAFTQYKNQVGGHLYGSKKYNAGNEFNILDGLDEVVAEPFAATVVKPLMSQYPDFITPSVYTMGDDGVSEGFDNSPRIMYSNGVVNMASTTYDVPAQNGGSANALEYQFLQFSHLSSIPTVTTNPPAITDTIDFHFGECQLLEGVGSASTNNLFNTYWLPYYNELYNPDTRIMTIKVNLTPADINTFKFNDTVMIKNRVFRVNKINYKPNDLATVEFILIP